MPTPAQLRALADEADAEADALEATAETCREQARTLRELADQGEGKSTRGVLHKRKQSGNVSDVSKHHALAIARAAAGEDPFLLHLAGKKISQNGLAKKVGCSAAAISRYRAKRPIPALFARRIQAAVGWPADAEHWPGGVV